MADPLVRSTIVTGLERTRAWLRLCRAIALTLCGVLCGASAHVLAGGPVPGLGLVAAIVVLLTVLTLPLALRPSRLEFAAPLLLAHQLATHAVLTMGSGSSARVSYVAEHRGHAPQSVTAGSGGHAAHALMPSPGMFAAHIGAAALLGWLIAASGQSWSGVGLAQRARRAGIQLVQRAGYLAAGLRTLSAPSLIRARTHQFVRWAEPIGAHPRDLWKSLPPARRGPPLLGQ